jgi:hypothetical protein
MTRSAVVLAASLALLACGDDEPGRPVDPATKKAPTDAASTRVPVPTITAKPSQETPEGTALLWLEAAKKGDADAAYALGTEEWRAKEKAGDRTFTALVASGRLRLLRWDLHPGLGEGDSATVTAAAVFASPDGQEDKERLAFQLVHRDERWWIVGLD